jgi:hypothetical protein
MNDKEHPSIEGKETLIAELGYWPEFCDAKIIELSYCPYTDDGARLSLVLHYIDMDLNRDLRVKFILYGVSDMDFEEFRTENVIDRLSISDSLIVEIEAATGLSGSCKCNAVAVEVISSSAYGVSP